MSNDKNPDGVPFKEALRTAAVQCGARVTNTGGLAFSPVSWEAFTARVDDAARFLAYAQARRESAYKQEPNQ